MHVHADLYRHHPRNLTALELSLHQIGPNKISPRQNFEKYSTTERHFYARDKFMQIHQNEALDKFHLCILVSNVWCDINLCNQRLTRIIHINKSHAWGVLVQYRWTPPYFPKTMAAIPIASYMMVSRVPSSPCNCLLSNVVVDISKPPNWKT